MAHPVVFIGYSHKDKNEKDQLVSHLGVLRRAGLLQVWTDEQIRPGSIRVQEIRKAMTEAKLAILLISANFFESDFIHDVEVQTLLKRSKEDGLVLFPLIAKPCAWRRIDWLADFSVRPKHGRPIWLRVDSPVDLDLSEIADEIASIIENEPETSSPNSPHDDQRSMVIHIRHDEVPALSKEFQAETIQNLATLMGVSHEEIEVHRITEGSIIFDLGIPPTGINHLRSYLLSNSQSLHQLDVERVILEIDEGKFEEWIIQLNEFHQLISSEGSDIIFLLNNGLDRGLSLVKYVQGLYRDAEDSMLSDPVRATELCRKALGGLEKGTSSESSDLDALRYSRGKFHLLLASIYLNEDRDSELAKKHFLESKNEFGSRKWFQLEALAYLGLAIARRKLKDLDGARDTSNNAIRSVSQEAIPESVNRTALEALRRAIENENSMILSLIFQLQIDPEPPKEVKQLPLFNISAGERLFGIGGKTGLKVLSLEDYERQTSSGSQVVVIDLIKRPSAIKADYVLSVNGNVEHDSDSLGEGDWLLIQGEHNLKHLEGSMVVVLSRNHTAENDIKTQATLNIFSQAQDHYFLEAQGQGSKSIVIAHYASDLSKINEYYANDRTVEIKRAYDVRISGVVIDHIPRESIENIVKVFLWQIPIVSHIAAGVGVITKGEIKEYLYLSEKERKNADFGVTVVGVSMNTDNILPDDIALIRQQPTIKDGEIAAVVIFTPESGPLGVLKKYHVVNERNEELRHWLLESSNPISADLVVMPSGVDFKAIRKLYEEKVEAGDIFPEFYENAEIAIAGKYVGVVRKN